MMERHRQIKNFIVSYITEHGYPPTFQEIGDGVYLSSKNSVQIYVRQMDDLGIIKVVPGQPRCISVPGYEFVKVESANKDANLELEEGEE